MDKLERLAGRANHYHRKATAAWRGALEHAFAAGKALNEAKLLVPYGQWDAWVVEHFEASPRLARDYKRIADTWHRPAMVEARRNLSITSIDAYLRCLRTNKAPQTEADGLRQEIRQQFDEWLELLTVEQLHYLSEHFDNGEWIGSLQYNIERGGDLVILEDTTDWKDDPHSISNKLSGYLTETPTS